MMSAGVLLKDAQELCGTNISRHCERRRSDSQRIPQRLGSAGHRIIREHLRMSNVTRTVINKGNETLTRIGRWRQWINEIKICMPGHPNRFDEKSMIDLLEII
jgi:hypothetical protein